jgi:hypothetical protein
MTAQTKIPIETYFAFTESDLLSPCVFLTGTGGIYSLCDSEDDISTTQGLCN